MSKHVICRRIEKFEAIRPMVGEELEEWIALKRDIDCLMENYNRLVDAMIIIKKTFNIK
ncbi:MAG: hypothetical protein NTV06_06240 [candidate division Zixibacteria bacterium]|nr:hypothetical protein [candidate division Zixibacteria bacterium]